MQLYVWHSFTIYIRLNCFYESIINLHDINVTCNIYNFISPFLVEEKTII